MWPLQSPQEQHPPATNMTDVEYSRLVSCVADGERVETQSRRVIKMASVSTFLVGVLGFAMPINGYNLSLSPVGRVSVKIFNLQNDEREM